MSIPFSEPATLVQELEMANGLSWITCQEHAPRTIMMNTLYWRVDRSSNDFRHILDFTPTEA